MQHHINAILYECYFTFITHQIKIKASARKILIKCHEEFSNGFASDKVDSQNQFIFCRLNKS